MQVVRFVNSIYASNSYILKKEPFEKVWLIDCGDAKPILEWLSKNKKILNGIFITHTHFDHIYGLNDVVSKFPQCAVYTSIPGSGGLRSVKLNLSQFNETPFVYRLGGNRTLKEGNSIELFPDTFLQVFETPGHDWSCLTYKIANNLFSGDSWLPNGKVIANFPKSDQKLALQSEKRICELAANCVIHPGHGKNVFIL